MPRAATEHLAAIEQAVEDHDARALIEYYFGIRLRPSQAELARVIAFREEDRVAIRAATQIGKTFTVAAALALKILLNEGHRVAVIAPTYAKTRIIQGYFADILVNSPHLRAMLDAKAAGVELLRKEASKTRVTFKDGGEVHFHSCEGDAMRLMGFGSYDTVVEEEAGETPDTIQGKISRMTSKKGCQRIKIGNPWRKPSHFYRACRDWWGVAWDYEVGIREGAYPPEFIEDERAERTETEFQVLYEARFPDTVTGALLHERVIEAAAARDFDAAWPIESVAVDVAEDGADFTVCTAIHRKPGGKARWARQLTISSGDPEAQVDVFARWIGETDAPVRYDAIGVGSAWGPLLRRRGYRAIPVKWSESPTDKARFARSKSEQYWNLRVVLEADILSLGKADPRLIDQLYGPTYEHTPAGKIEVKVPGRKTGQKSPDHADSLVLACVPIKVGGRVLPRAW